MPDFETPTKEAVVAPVKEKRVKAPPVEEKPKEEYSKEELSGILDTIMFEGEYSETVTVKGKLKVIFRTRTAEETTEVSRIIDGKMYNLMTTIQEERALYNLAFSLTNYNGMDLSKVKPLPDRFKYVSKLPIFVVSALADALAKFDKKVDTACREFENF